MSEPKLLWAYVSDKGVILPSTIREKVGDADGCLAKLHLYRHSVSKTEFKRVRIEVRIIEEPK
jgi:hypothetical protein